MNNDNTTLVKSQEQRIFSKILRLRKQNEKVIDWLLTQPKPHSDKAFNLEDCGTAVGITRIGAVAKIYKANFCRERVCAVCAWRRQAKFLAQMHPTLTALRNKGFSFLFVTLTIKNSDYENLRTTVDRLMTGVARLKHHVKIKRSFKGIIRSLELTFNKVDKTFHPHIHMLVAVTDDYFKNADNYITHSELTELWRRSIGEDYVPVCDIRKVGDDSRACVETLKYALKPNKSNKALSALFYGLKGRRLISFSGVFAKVRKELSLTDFETVLTDDIPQGVPITYDLFTLDATGGVFKFFDTFELK